MSGWGGDKKRESPLIFSEEYILILQVWHMPSVTKWRRTEKSAAHFPLAGSARCPDLQPRQLLGLLWQL